MTSTPLGQPIVVSALPTREHSFPIASTAASWSTPTALVVGVLALGLALEVNFGQYHPTAMPWLTLALIACLAAAILPNFGSIKLARWRPDQVLLAIALSIQFALLYTRPPAATLKLNTPEDIIPFKAALALAAAVVAVAASGTRAARFAVPAVLLAHLSLGVWIIRATPAPGIDVYVFQRDSCEALLDGKNPYALTFPDIYNGELPVYGEDLVKGGRLLFGYPYPPLSLVFALPAHLLGDFRYGHLVCLTLAGALIAYARPPVEGGAVPSARAVGAAALLLFTPRGFFVIEAGWTEPLAILMLAATIFAACRRGPRWGIACAIAFGLLLGSKQYLVLALPLVLLLPLPRIAGRIAKFAFLALAVAAVVTLPLALWDIPAFIHSVLTLQFHQPMRPDALSYLSRSANIPAWTPFAITFAAMLLCLWRTPRTPAGFAMGLALTLFAFFATNKQAFCNYYALVLASMCCALAALPGLTAAKPRPI
jgi:hypothetical protein